MNSILKKSFVFAVCCAVLSMASVSAYAYSIPYNTSVAIRLETLKNNTASKQTVSANTRPKVGTGGAVIEITKADGTVTASKLFPYQTSVSALNANLPAGNTRYMKIKPYSNGQNIQGTVTCNIN